MRALGLVLCGLAVMLPPRQEPVTAGNSNDPGRQYGPDSVTVALYHLNDSTAASVTDTTENHLYANVIGTTWTRDGRFGGCRVFDGDDCIIIPDYSDLTATRDATFEAWVNLASDVTSWMIILEKMIPFNAVGRGLGINPEGKAVAYAIQNPILSEAVSTNRIPKNQWVHLAAVFDEGNLRMRIIVNGVTEDDVRIACCTWSGNLPVTIGCGRLVPDYYLGKIDEVRISSVPRDLLRVAVQPSSWGRIKTLWR